MDSLGKYKFLGILSLVLARTGFIHIVTTETYAADSKGMFVHHVYFWQKNAGNKEEQARLLKGLQTLTKIETIKTVHIGVPADTNRSVIDTSYQFSLLLIFDNRKDQDIYQNHPVHLKFVEKCSSLLGESNCL